VKIKVQVASFPYLEINATGGSIVIKIGALAGQLGVLTGSI